MEIIWKQGEDTISKLFEEEQQSFSLEKDQIMITNAKKYEGMKFIYEKKTPTKKRIPKEKDEIVEIEREEEGMSKGSETQGKCYDPVGSWFCPFGAILTSITAALSALSLPLSSFSFLFVFLLLFSPVLFLLFLLFVMLISALFCCSYL